MGAADDLIGDDPGRPPELGEHQPDAFVIALYGELVLGTKVALEQQLELAQSSSHEHVMVDLSG